MYLCIKTINLVLTLLKVIPMCSKVIVYVIIYLFSKNVGQILENNYLS